MNEVSNLAGPAAIPWGCASLRCHHLLQEATAADKAASCTIGEVASLALGRQLLRDFLCLEQALQGKLRRDVQKPLAEQH